MSSVNVGPFAASVAVVVVVVVDDECDSCNCYVDYGIQVPHNVINGH